MTKYEPREGYWFSDRSGKLPHGDGREYSIGEKLSVKGKLKICKNALHGSFDPYDALQYAPGPMLHKVLFSGGRIEESDKVGSRSRTILASRDAEAMLGPFARRQALTVASTWKMPEVVRQYLETGDETIRSAALSAARSAAAENVATRRSAAESAAFLSAARSASVTGTVWLAARSAARSAVQSAASSAARGASPTTATRSVAYSAAESAALSAARQMFNEMVEELFEAIDAKM
jgi:hypothetical protein